MLVGKTRQELYNNKCLQEELDIAKKRSLKRETESLLEAAQNNTFSSSYIEAKNDHT